MNRPTLNCQITVKRKSKVLQLNSYLPNRLSHDYATVTKAINNISTKLNDSTETSYIKNANFYLDSETFLILDLLQMGYNERKQFLYDTAKHIGLLVFDKKLKSWTINSQLININSFKYHEIDDVKTLQKTNNKLFYEENVSVGCNEDTSKYYKINDSNVLLFNEKITSKVANTCTNLNDTSKFSKITFDTSDDIIDLQDKTNLIKKSVNERIKDEESQDKLLLNKLDDDAITNSDRDCHLENIHERILRIKSTIEMRLNKENIKTEVTGVSNQVLAESVLNDSIKKINCCESAEGGSFDMLNSALKNFNKQYDNSSEKVMIIFFIQVHINEKYKCN